MLGKTSTPFIVIEYPNYNQPHKPELFNFKNKDYETNYLQTQNKLVQYANPKNKETIKLIKNSEKEFQKINKLKNICLLKVSLYEPAQKTANPLDMLDKARIKGTVQTDP